MIETADDAENDNILQGGCSVMRLDGFGLLVEVMAKMIRFYRDVMTFSILDEPFVLHMRQLF